MSRMFDCSDPASLLTGMRLARTALGRGELVVLPTDTVYGLAADAFSPDAVARLRSAKGRDRSMPPPVLIPNVETLAAVAEEVPEPVTRLVEAFWPGGLTIILHARSSLAWDLGETHGTVAVRIPQHTVALELLHETGPLAVSSANLTGQPAANSAAEAMSALGDAVSVYLEAGLVASAKAGNHALPSTIVDATALRYGGRLRIVRAGVIPRAALAELVGAEFLEEAGP